METRKDRAAQTADRWYQQYMMSETEAKPEFKGGRFSDKALIYQQLKELGENPDPDEVDAVIGNSSWTRITCHHCGSDVERAVWAGEPVDYESYSALICEGCAKKIVSEFS